MLIALIVSVLPLALLVRRQIILTRRGRGEPLVPATLFAIPSFRNGNIATLHIGLSEFGIPAVMPLWLEFTGGYSPVQAGLALAVLAVGSFTASDASFALTAASPR